MGLHDTRESLDEQQRQWDSMKFQSEVEASGYQDKVYDCEYCLDTGEEYRDEYDKDGHCIGIATMGPYQCVCKLQQYDDNE